MKKALLSLIFLLIVQTSYGIGHPHNLFAARKAMLEWRAEQQRHKAPATQRAALLPKRYSCALLTRLARIAA